MGSPLQSILDSLAALAVDGMTGRQLDAMAATLIKLHGCEPAFLDYTPDARTQKKGFPAVLCVSVNNEVIHGIPDDRKLEWGDIVTLDLGLKQAVKMAGGDPVYEYDDGATTVIVGSTIQADGTVRYAGSAVARRLLKATQEALGAGLAQAKAGKTTHDIAKAIAAVAAREGFGIVKGYGGHGIGSALHMEPHIPNEPVGEAVPLVAGTRICVEPMFSSKRGDVVTAPNGWTVKLAGGGVAAHFERSVLVE